MSGAPIPKAKPRKKPKNQRDTAVADALFSKLVRSPGRCHFCGTTEHLQCMHLFSRRYRAVRWDPTNAVVGCRGCHLKYTMRPIEWDDWMVSHLGPEGYAELRARALNGPLPDMTSLIASLRRRVETAA